MSKSTEDYSTNERAEKLIGKRDLPEGTVIFDMPHELGYQCPVCKLPEDEYLNFSEYNGFLWCERCDKDYPSVLCQPDVNRAIDTYLDTVEQATDRIRSLPQIKRNEVDLKLFLIDMKNNSLAYDLIAADMEKRGWVRPALNNQTKESD